MNQKVLYDLPDHYFTNGRDLHSLSGSKEDYITWFRSTFGNRYTEGKDYVQVIVSVPGPDGQPECLIDHRLLPYMAVYAVMMMPNEAGHIMRDTAIQIMAQWVNVDCVIAHASEIINIYSDKGDYSYATRILERCPSIRSCYSRLAYEEWIAKSNEPRTITEIGRDYGLSAVRLNRILESMDVQYRVYGTWRLRSIYDAAGYVVKESHGYGDQEGAYHEGYRLKWTPKGQLFICRLLKTIGIHPYQEAFKHG